jgi:nodulation protein F
MTGNFWPAKFDQLLREELPLLPPGVPLSTESSLVDLGLDSLGVVALITKIEDHYGVELDDQLDDPKLFSTPEYLWSIIQELRHGDRSPAPDVFES